MRGGTFRRFLVSALAICGAAAAQHQNPPVPDYWSKHIESGQALESKGRYAEAKEEFDKALRTSSGTPRNPGTFASQVELGKVAAAMGQYVEAEQWDNEAARSGFELFGRNAAELAIPYTNLAALYRDQGKYKEAEDFCRRALGLIPALPAGLSAARAHVLGTLGGILYHRGKLPEAEAVLQESIEIAKNLPAGSGILAGDWSNLAGVYAKAGRHAEALARFEDAYAIYEKIGGGNDPRLFAVLTGMAAARADAGNYAGAVSAVQSSIELAEAEGAGNTMLVHNALLAEADWLHKLKRDGEARKARAKAKQVAKAASQNSYARYSVDARQVAQAMVGPTE